MGQLPSRSRTRKIKGHRRMRLISQLAKGSLSYAELAEKYDVVESTIKRFAVREAENIERVRKNAEDKLASLWIAEKLNRLAEYEADVEAINKRTERGVDEDNISLIRAKHNALKSVAEELGQLPSKISVDVEAETKVNHIINGVDMGDLT